MSSMLVSVPKIRDMTPKAHTSTFFHSNHLPENFTKGKLIFGYHLK